MGETLELYLSSSVSLIFCVHQLQIFKEFIVNDNQQIVDDTRQVQFPLSLVSIKYKHFLLFGLGVPFANTLLWLILRLYQKVTITFLFVFKGGHR